MPKGFVIHAADDVATMLGDASFNESVEIVGEAKSNSIVSKSDIKLGHKIAIRAIASGEVIKKFGVPIGRATQEIAVGDWVHLHNVSSAFDERSNTFDLHSGATTDTKYE